MLRERAIRADRVGEARAAVPVADRADVECGRDVVPVADGLRVCLRRRGRNRESKQRGDPAQRQVPRTHKGLHSGAREEKHVTPFLEAIQDRRGRPLVGGFGELRPSVLRTFLAETRALQELLLELGTESLQSRERVVVQLGVTSAHVLNRLSTRSEYPLQSFRFRVHRRLGMYPSTQSETAYKVAASWLRTTCAVRRTKPSSARSTSASLECATVPRSSFCASAVRPIARKTCALR